MGKGACAEPRIKVEAPKSLKAEAPGLLQTLHRVVSDFINTSADTRAEYYRVDQMPRRPKEEQTPLSRDGEYTRAEVAKHASVDDCWIIVKGKVYDVTWFAPEHPGGRVIYTYGGKDATDVFSAFHAGSTWSKLSEYLIGRLTGDEADAPVDPIVSDFRDLRLKLKRDGMFNSSKPYYAMVAARTLSLAVAAYAALWLWGRSWAGFTASAALLALFWQQCGWLAHDLCHNQVFENRGWNTIGGLMVGGVWAGFSVDWWKGKHNTHHAAPNEVTAGGMPVDPDIDTLPLIAWSPDLLGTVKDPAYRAFLRMQHVLFFPLLTFARLSWAQQSAAHPNHTAKHTANARPTAEKLSLLLHYAWLAAFALSRLRPLPALLYVALAQLIAGFILSLVFVQNHNGMEIYSATRDFFTAQIVSTRDIDGSLFNDFFTGGLNYQVEHHLFPTLPRHNLGRVRRMVMEICHKHGLAYESCSLPQGTAKVLKTLADIAALA